MPGEEYIYGQAISAGGSLLASQFDSGPSLRKQKRDQRELIKNQAKYEPSLIHARTSADWQARFDAAKKHGVHPLVAMGIAPTASGGGVSGGVYGQSDRGSHIARAADSVADTFKVPYLAKERLKAEIALIRAQAAALGQRGPSVPGPHGQNIPADATPPYYTAGEKRNPPASEPTTRQVEQGRPGSPQDAAGAAKPSFEPLRMGGFEWMVPGGDWGELEVDSPVVLGMFLEHPQNKKNFPPAIWKFLKGKVGDMPAVQISKLIKAFVFDNFDPRVVAKSKVFGFNRDEAVPAARKRRYPRSYR